MKLRIIGFGLTLTSNFSVDVVKYLEVAVSAEYALPILLWQRPVTIGGILRSLIFVMARSRQEPCLCSADRIALTCPSNNV